MTDQRNPLIERLESWLGDDDGAVLSERVMNALIAEVPLTPQVRAGWSRAFAPTSRAAKISYAVAGVAAAAVLVLVYAQWASDNVGEPSPSPSPEPSASEVPESTPLSFPPAAASSLDVGGVGIVVATEPLVVRSAPGTGPDSTIMEERLWPGMRFGIVEGPVTASGYDWYFIQVGELTGWAAMASAEGEPWMASVANGLIAYGTRSGDAMELRAIAPGQEPSLIASFSPGDLQLETNLDSTEGGGAVDCPGGLEITWSPQGDQLALAASSACNGVIYTLNADGTRLLRHSDGQSPVWSSDGTRIAFGLNAPWFACGPSCHEYPPGGWEVQVVVVDGGAPTSLTDSPVGTSAGSPLWSPDGGTLAFLSTDLLKGPNGSEWESYEVRLINADGTGQRFLTDGHAIEWSRDGRSLFVWKWKNQSTVEGWVVRADGSGEIGLSVQFPQFTGLQRTGWSPDGSRMALSGWNEESGTQTYVVSPDSPDVTPIRVAGSFEAWSPDGRGILLSREGPNGEIELVRFALSDGQIEVVGAGMGILDGFAWQPVLVYPGP